MLTSSPAERATQILLSYLSPHQVETLHKHNFFYVHGRDERNYAITDDGLLWRIGYGGHILCRHNMWAYAQDLPMGDRMLALFLFLDANGPPHFCVSEIHLSGYPALDSGRHFKAFLEERYERELREVPAGPPQPLPPSPPLRDYWPQTGGLWGH